MVLWLEPWQSRHDLDWVLYKQIHTQVDVICTEVRIYIQYKKLLIMNFWTVMQEVVVITCASLVVVYEVEF
jgi:hypothetical protein